MRRPRRSVINIALPLRPLIYKISLALLLIFSVTLLIVSRTNPQFSQSIRYGITDIVVPVMNALTKPLDAIGSGVEWVEGWASLHAENAMLRQENARLLQWQAAARELDAENHALRELLRVTPAASSSYITSRIVGDTGGAYGRSALVYAGTTDGVAEGQAVISDDGLVGRVIDAGANSSRVLLVTDTSSRVPVMGETSRERAILAGNNTDTPTLLYLPDDSKLEPGERLVTSGDGGIIPPGLPVGIVSDIPGGNTPVPVLLFSNWYRVEYVSVVQTPRLMPE